MKTTSLKLSFAVLCTAFTLNTQAQIKPVLNGNTNIAIRDLNPILIEGEVDGITIIDTLPYPSNNPDSVPSIFPTTVPIKPGTPDSGHTVISRYACEANGMCIRETTIRIYYCITPQGEQQSHSRINITIECFRTVGGKCESTLWEFEKRSPFNPNCIANAKTQATIDGQQVINEELPTGIQSLFPNPIKDEATFKLHLANNSDKISIKIMDINGRVVDELNQENVPDGDVSVTTNFSHLANGMYSAAFYVNGAYTNATKMIIAH